MDSSGLNIGRIRSASGASASNADMENRSSAPEFYGFVALTSTYALFVLYLLWAILPDEYIVMTGVTWYPSREWSLLIPAWSVVVILLTYMVYFSLAIVATPSFQNMNSITDVRANLPRRANDSPLLNPYLESAQPGAIPQLYDVPIGVVNRVIYRKPTEETT